MRWVYIGSDCDCDAVVVVDKTIFRKCCKRENLGMPELGQKTFRLVEKSPGRITPYTPLFKNKTESTAQ